MSLNATVAPDAVASASTIAKPNLVPGVIVSPHQNLRVASASRRRTARVPSVWSDLSSGEYEDD